MTHEELTHELEQAMQITNPQMRAYRIQAITNAMYGDELPTLREQAYERKYKRTEREISAQRAGTHTNAAGTHEDGSEAEHVNVTEADEQAGEAWIRETPSETMVAQGGNAAWLRAIELAEINATPEGIARAQQVQAMRNVSATRVRTRKVRAQQAEATEARKAKAKAVREAKGAPKSRRRRAPVVLPSKAQA